MIKSTFFHPKFFQTWLLFALMKLSAKLSFKTQIKLGGYIGILLYLLLSKRRKIAYTNIARCFNKRTKEQVQDLVKQHFKALGIGFFEVSNCFYISSERLRKLYQIKGSKHLKNALAKQYNIILLVGHFSTMMLAGRILAQNFYFADIYRPQNNVLFDYLMCRNFTQHGSTMVKAKDTRNIIKTLKSGLPIWYAADQDLGEKNSIFAPFFNIPTATITATAKLAKIPNTKVIPVSFIRNAKGYHISFQAPILNYPTGDVLADAITTNAILEAQILKAPEQYLWIHKRFKTRPDKNQSFYDDI